MFARFGDKRYHTLPRCRRSSLIDTPTDFLKRLLARFVEFSNDRWTSIFVIIPSERIILIVRADATCLTTVDHFHCDSERVKKRSRASMVHSRNGTSRLLSGWEIDNKSYSPGDVSLCHRPRPFLRSRLARGRYFLRGCAHARVARIWFKIPRRVYIDSAELTLNTFARRAGGHARCFVERTFLSRDFSRPTGVFRSPGWKRKTMSVRRAPIRKRGY